MPDTIPPFNLAQVGILPKMSPMTDLENALLNLAQGSPVMHTDPPGLGQGQSRTERSSCSRSPMSLGSPAGMSLALALKVHTCPVMPATFGSREELPRDGAGKRWMPQRMMPKRRKTEDGQQRIHPASMPCLAHHWVRLEDL